MERLKHPVGSLKNRHPIKKEKIESPAPGGRARGFASSRISFAWPSRRQVHFEGRSPTHLARYFKESAVAFDDAHDGGQPEARSLVGFFRGEERIKNPVQ